MPRFDLRNLIRATIREHPVASLSALVTEVEAGIPDDKLRATLRELLPFAIRPEMRPVHTPAQTWVGTDHSAKRQARRELTETGTWPVLLPREMGGGWTELKDLTADDCEKLANRYESKAMESNANARRYRALARAVREAKAEKVGDLKREQVLMILGVDDDAGLTMLLHGV